MGVLRVKDLIARGWVRNGVLSGGFGARLDAVTDAKRNKWPLAKPACPYGNATLIDSSIKALLGIGATNINLLTCILPHTIMHIVGNGMRYGENVRIFEHKESESDPLDTAGAVGQLVHSQGWHSNAGEIIIIPSADNVINGLDIGAVIDAHLFNRANHGAVATIVVNPVTWDTIDRFGTVRLTGMPRREDFKEDVEFEAASEKWDQQNLGQTVQIEEFREKKPRSVPRKKEQEVPPNEPKPQAALSRCNNSSFYVMDLDFYMTLLGMLTKKDSETPLIPSMYVPGSPAPFSDWGKHVFKWLTEEPQREKYPIYAYIMNGYWRGADTGEELRKLNMDTIDRQFEAGLVGLTKFTDNTGHTSWRGENTFIDPKAQVNNSIIQKNVIIKAGAEVVHSNVGDNAIVGEQASMYGTVVFSQHMYSSSGAIIGPGTTLIDCLVLGGKTEDGAEFRRVQVFDPYGGVAIGSMNGKTQYSNP